MATLSVSGSEPRLLANIAYALNLIEIIIRLMVLVSYAPNRMIRFYIDLLGMKVL
jgi:hypothetical protein